MGPAMRLIFDLILRFGVRRMIQTLVIEPRHTRLILGLPFHVLHVWWI